MLNSASVCIVYVSYRQLYDQTAMMNDLRLPVFFYRFFRIA